MPRCRLCGGGAYTRWPAYAAADTWAQGTASHGVAVEYIGARSGSRNYKTPSGRVYLFSSHPAESRRYVAADDAAFFAALVDFTMDRLG